MKASFAIIALTIIFSINFYVALRGWQSLALTPSFRLTFLITLIVLFVALLSGMIFGHLMPPAIGRAVTFVGFTYVIVFVYLFLSFLVVDVVRIANYFIHFLPSGMLAFRQWALVGTLCVTAVALVVGNYNFNRPKIVSLHLSSNKPKQHKHLKIVAATDIHLGVSIDKARLRSYVQLINNQQPDIVLLAGDITDRSIVPVINQHMDEELRQLKAKYGVFAINGNHEHYAETLHATQEYLTKAGVVFLRDSVSLVDNSFYIVGRDDRSNLNRKNLTTLVQGLNKNLPTILLDHQPYHLEEAEQSNVDIQLSGHTHNGQFFPGNLFVKRMYELGHGYLKKGNTNYYVSSGLGIWGPQYRIGTQSELVVIDFEY